MEQRHISGLSAVLVQGGEIKWYKNYGLANREENIPVGENTVFMIASVSKTITGTALMQLYEDSLFQLNDPVNDYLPFSVINPNHPDSAITFLQLLTHTSSIRDNWPLLVYFDGDAPIALGDFLFDYLDTTGADYNAALNYYTYAPLTTYNYCNVAVALCGYLVETISGMPFNEFCNTNIFEPLCMENTGWFLSEVDTPLVAHPYSYIGGAYVDNGLYGYPDYPDGQLRTTSLSLAKFMTAHMQYGAFDGIHILDSSTVALMRSSVVPTIDPTQGLIFYKYSDAYGTWWGHNGGDAGASTNMYFNEATETGLIILTNGDGNHDPIWNEILASADSLLSGFVDEVSCDITIPAPVIHTAPISYILHPNPSSGTLFISGEQIPDRLEVYDLSGKLILQKDGVRWLQVETFPTGIYWLNIFSGDNVARMQWVKI